MTSSSFDPATFLDEQSDENAVLLAKLRSELSQDDVKGLEEIIECGIARLRNRYSEYMQGISKTLEKNFLTPDECRFTLSTDKREEAQQKAIRYLSALNPKGITTGLFKLLEELTLDDYCENLSELASSDQNLRFLSSYIPNPQKLNHISKRVGLHMLKQNMSYLEDYAISFSEALTKLKGTEGARKFKKGVAVAASIAGAFVSPVRGGGRLGKSTAGFLMGMATHRKLPKTVDTVTDSWESLLPRIDTSVEELETAYRIVRTGLYCNFLNDALPKLNSLGMILSISKSTSRILISPTEAELKRRMLLKLKFFGLSLKRIDSCRTEDDIVSSYENILKLQQWLDNQSDIHSTKMTIAGKDRDIRTALRKVKANVYRRFERYMLSCIRSAPDDEDKDQLWVTLLSKNDDDAGYEVREEIKMLQMTILNKNRQLVADRHVALALKHIGEELDKYKDVDSLRPLLSEEHERLQDFYNKTHSATNVRNELSLKERKDKLEKAKKLYAPDWLKNEIRSTHKRLLVRRYLYIAAVVLAFGGIAALAAI